MMDRGIWHYLKRFWVFIWHEDSLASWVVSVILAFLLVKFMIYPGLGLILGTTHPIVAVVSGSMEHKMVSSDGKYVICGTEYDEKEYVDFGAYWEVCGEFYEKNNISKEQFHGFRFRNGFNTGDVMVIFGTEPKDIKIGDVIVFKSNRRDPIIHRVVAINKQENELIFKTKGDHNGNIGYDEKNIEEEMIIGRAVLRIPLLGYVKLMFVRLLGLIGIGG